MANLIFPRYCLLKITVEQIEYDESYLPKVVGVYLLEIAAGQIKSSESYPPEVTEEQIEAISLISLKLQWSRLKSSACISLKVHWSRSKL
ncbi:Primosomal N' [Gossypium arboreum]|uniref:Primosomal N n=1 Tax=Gossypium arboreum TaxID=29729 RepID=A0A0B0MFT3_GOSAR|nr:Primosomal N' [Gossypium arboreum]